MQISLPDQCLNGYNIKEDQEDVSSAMDTCEKLLSELLNCLLTDNRLDDIRLIADNEEARKHLYKEYGLLEDE